MRRIGFLSLVAVTVAVYVAIVAWSLPMIAREAGGLVPFDLRPGGYSLGEAKAFLEALSSEGRDAYLGRQQALDVVYPPLIALTLAWSLLWAGRPYFGRWSWLAAVASLAICPLDYLENVGVRAMLRAGPEVTEHLVAATSRWTVAKSVVTTAMFILLLALLLVRGGGCLRSAWRRRRGDAVPPESAGG